MKARIISLFVLAGLVFTGCSAGGTAATETTPIPTVLADEALIAEGRIEPVRYAEIAFNVSGVIGEVLVTEGQAVRAGEPLIQLGNESDRDYAAAQLELVTAQQELDNLFNSSGGELAQAVINLKDAQEAFEKADNYLIYLQNSRKVPQTETRVFLIQTFKGYEYQYKTKNFKGPAPEDWIIEAENDLAVKKAALDDAQRAYDRLKDGVDSDQRTLLEARLNAAKAGVAAFTVVAPFDGTVADLPAQQGSSINVGDVAVTIADFSHWIVKTTDLTELDVVTVQDGQPTVITLDAIPDVALNGEIQSISQTFEEKQGDVVYEVTVALQDGHPSLRWGMTAIVTFDE
ncbi:MAG TPA: HlyD family efflux transporter periplasmic adaptor subunit [Anaerolineales bacterium]|nr:HlyD family efflux transporter periplasmic adaptor subunit [Anaerolineales bacterium]